MKVWAIALGLISYVFSPWAFSEDVSSSDPKENVEGKDRDSAKIKSAREVINKSQPAIGVRVLGPERMKISPQDFGGSVGKSRSLRE